MQRPIITLTTDFGLKDAYVAQMKGVILSINGDANIVDVTHEIPPQDVGRAALLIAETYHRFPERTTHVVVIDPGVGSARTPLALEAAGHRFIAPDNGVLSHVAVGCDNVRAVELTNDRFWHHPVSNTFHGRDLFAPVAAHVSLGIDLSELGPPLGSPLSPLDLPRAVINGDEITGEVLWADSFGNLVTNIESSQLPAKCRKRLHVVIGDRHIAGVQSFYAEAGQGELLALVGSSGRLEIAVREGSAAGQLNCRRGAVVRVTGIAGASNETGAQ